MSPGRVQVAFRLDFVVPRARLSGHPLKFVNVNGHGLGATKEPQRGRNLIYDADASCLYIKSLGWLCQNCTALADMCVYS